MATALVDVIVVALVASHRELERLDEQIASLSALREAGLGGPSQRPAGAGPVSMLAAGFRHRPAVES
jgi:hypothetical protein